MARAAALLLLSPLCLFPGGDCGALAAPPPLPCADQASSAGAPSCAEASSSFARSHGPSLLQLSSAAASRRGPGELRKAHITQRRRLGAKLLSATETGATASFLASFEDEVKEYAGQYHRAASRSSLTFFLHVSKTAGTLLCRVGKQNGCRAPDNMGLHGAINCNMWDDRLVWRAPLHGTVKGTAHPDPEQRPGTCEGLSALYAGHNLTLASTESYLIAESLCPEFFNVMVLRDPTSRLMSQLSMDLEDGRKTDDGRTFVEGRGSWEAAPASPAVIFEHMPASSNNFFIRSLLGRDVYTLPFGSVTPAHLDMAKRVLEGFDVLLVGESHRPASLVTDIAARLGLQAGEHRTFRTGKTDDYKQNLNWTQADWDALRAANALDMELWQHAKNLDLVDASVFAHPAFPSVSATMPHSPCGFLSK